MKWGRKWCVHCQQCLHHHAEDPVCVESPDCGLSINSASYLTVSLKDQRSKERVRKNHVGDFSLASFSADSFLALTSDVEHLLILVVVVPPLTHSLTQTQVRHDFKCNMLQITLLFLLYPDTD